MYKTGMGEAFPSLTTDQVAAFCELARCGSLHLAAASLHVTEQGVRNRLLALERRLGVELYRKSRGPRRSSPLTRHGRIFLHRALAFLDTARDLTEAFETKKPSREIHVAASQYLLTYVVIDAVRKFHATRPHLRVRLSTQSESAIEQVLINDAAVELGIAAPYEPTTDLEYHHMFSMDWSLIVPVGHRLMEQKRVRLHNLTSEPLILFERGSTGRQHILDAFQKQKIIPQVRMETTTTEIVVRMVEAGLGVAIVPLLPSGAVTRGRKVGVVGLAAPIRPIDSGILTRKGETLSEPAREFVAFMRGVDHPR